MELFFKMVIELLKTVRVVSRDKSQTVRALLVLAIFSVTVAVLVIASTRFFSAASL